MDIEHDATGLSPTTEGERWTRAALSTLRERRYTPRAWVRFIGASAVRSVEDLHQRPGVALEAALVAAVGAAPWILARDRGALAWWGAVSAMLLSHVGMLESASGERRSGLGLPNALTLGRAWLIPLIARTRDRRTFAALATFAFASDALDGALARDRDEETRLGAQMDHAVDAALTIAVAEAARRRGWLPRWMVAVVATRYAAPVALIGAYYFARAEAPPREGFIPARAAGVLVATGLVVAAAGQRRIGTFLASAGIGWGSALAVRSGSHAVAG